MATKIQVKRGTHAKAIAHTPDVGEPLFDLETKRLSIGNNSLASGISVTYNHDCVLNLEKQAEIMRNQCASGWLPPHTKQSAYQVNPVQSGVGYIEEINSNSYYNYGVSYRIIYRNSKSLYVAKHPAYAQPGYYWENRIEMSDIDSKICVNGYVITLEQNPNYANNVTIDLPAAPTTGVRNDLVIIEVWKEKVVLGVADDCLFPHGNVGFDPHDKETTFDSCTLYSTTQTGGNWPAYLAGTYGNPTINSSYHGKYVKTNDANIALFIANPKNNVGVDKDGNLFQVRYRICTLTDVEYTKLDTCDISTDGIRDASNNFYYFKAQGQKASRSANDSLVNNANYPYFIKQSGYNLTANTIQDSGLILGGYRSSWGALQLKPTGFALNNDYVYAIPICMVARRNTTAYNAITNPNGAGTITSTVSGRPDGKFSDQVHKDDILDLRHRVQDGDFNYASILEENKQAIYSSTLSTSCTPIKSTVSKNNFVANGFKLLGSYAPKHLRYEGISGTNKRILDMFSTTGSNLITNGDFSDGTTGWNPTYLTLSIGAGQTGNGLILTVNTATQSQKTVSKAVSPFVKGKIYKVSFSVKNISAKRRTICASIGGTSTVSPEQFTEYIDVTDQWKTVTFYVTMVGTSLAQGATGTGTFWVYWVGQVDVNDQIIIDDVSFYEVNVGTDYIISDDEICNNQISSRFDGFRNYYSDQPGDQAVFDRFDNLTTSKQTGFASLTLPSDGVIWGRREDGFRNVVVPLGSTGATDDVHTYTSSVIKDDTTYKMWYGGYDGYRFRIHYATSTDGVTWTKYSRTDGLTDPIYGNLNGTPVVVPLGTSGSTDDYHIYTPVVIKDGTTYKMWYGASDGVNANYRIHYATSTDGVTWTKYSRTDGLTDPIYGNLNGTPVVVPLGTSGSTDDYGINSASVIKDDTTYKMWYGGTDGSYYRIHYATSTDGVTWTKQGVVLDLGVSGSTDDYYIYNPVVIKDGTTYKMWYSTYDGTNCRIQYATSTDGVTWTKQGVVLDLGVNGSTDDYNIYSSFVIKDGSTYKMWYDGTDGAGSNYRIHYTESVTGLYITPYKLASYNPSNSLTPNISTQDPEVTWTDGSNHVSYPGACKVDIAWYTHADGSKVGIISPKTHCYIGTSSTQPTVAQGDVYTSPNAVNVTITGAGYYNNSNFSGIFTGTTIPNTGTYTKVSGSGPATINVSSTIEVGNKYPTWNQMPQTPRVYSGEGSNLHSTKGLFVKSYISFREGSSYLKYIPYKDNSAIKGSQFYINGTQVLPNNGVGFQPFGVSIDPLNDPMGPTDSTIKSAGLIGFKYNIPVLDVSASGIDIGHIYSQSVIKDGSTYKMWYAGHDGTYYRICYATSTDGVTWTKYSRTDGLTDPLYGNLNGTPCVLPLGVDGQPDDTMAAYLSVIKDGSTYKIWYTGHDGTFYRICYATSTDGVTWTKYSRTDGLTDPLYGNLNGTPVVVPIGESGATDRHTYYPSVIKDGSTYKMWYSGSDGVNSRIHYATSTDGVTWTKQGVVVDIGIAGQTDNIRIISPQVIKDGTIYKMWYAGSFTIGGYRNHYAISTDGITWAKQGVILDLGINGSYDDYYSCFLSVIKDDTTYKIWYTGNDGSRYRISHAILTMTDINNTGSSLTGVYSTTGTDNFAPGVNDNVVVMYEHRAIQQNFGRIVSGNLSYKLKYIDDKMCITSLGTGGSPENGKYVTSYRDFIGTYFPSYESTYSAYIGAYFLDGKDISLEGTSFISETTMNCFTNNFMEIDYTFCTSTVNISAFPKTDDNISRVSTGSVSMNGMLVLNSPQCAFSNASDLYLSPKDSYLAITDKVKKNLFGVGSKFNGLFIIGNMYPVNSPATYSSVIFNAIGNPIEK